MKTFMANPQTVERKWYVVDATDMILGRVASEVAAVLRGKNKPTYTPHVDCGDYVIVVNCDKIKVTGKKLTDKYHYHYSGYAGGLKAEQFKDVMQLKPQAALEWAVKGMLPKNSLGHKMLKHLKCYAGSEHEQAAQQPVALNIKGGKR